MCDKLTDSIRIENLSCEHKDKGCDYPRDLTRNLLIEIAGTSKTMQI